MSKYHSIVTRRDFMKGLGLAGAGLGAAAAAAPVFHDLDELVSAADDNFKRPWWISERDFKDSTTEVDWGIMTYWDWNYPPIGTDVANPRHGQLKPYGDDSTRAQVESWVAKSAGVGVSQSGIRETGLKNNTPGYQLRDYALADGAGYLSFGRGLESVPWEGPDIPSPADRGVAKWSGSPEEATKMFRAVAHHFGAANAGVVEFDSDTKKFFYPSKNRFEDVDEPYMDGRVGVIPNKCQWGIYLVVRQSDEMTKRHLSKQNVAPSYGYMHGPIILLRMQRFIKGLGYLGLGGTGAHYTAAGMNMPMGVMAGLSELGRMNHQMTPEWGTMIRYSPGLPTDLPLAPTKPIDAGMAKFCETCKLCAEFCREHGGGGLSLETEPTYEITGPWNRAGVKKHHQNWALCCYPAGCGLNCGSPCPFNTKGKGSASAHEVIKSMVASTSLFNSFFASMEHTFYKGYRDEEDFAAWWDRDLKTWQYDCVYF